MLNSFLSNRGAKLEIKTTLSKNETFEKCSILLKVKEGEDFNHRHTLGISRIKI